MKEWKLVLINCKLGNVHVRRELFQEYCLSPLLFLVNTISVSKFMKSDGMLRVGKKDFSINYLVFMADVVILNK